MDLTPVTRKFILLMAFCAIPLSSALSQESRQCEEILGYAETYYEQNRIDEAISLLADCLRSGDVPDDVAVRGYRLLTLAFLRNDDVAQARLAVVELLGIDPTYTPDPVTDLPVYNSLVESTRRQLAIEQTLAMSNQPEEEPEVAAPDTVVVEMPPPPVETMDTEVSTGTPVAFKARFGLSGYGGERGRTAESSIGEFGDNAGPAFEIGAEYQLAEPFAMGVFYGPAKYSHIHDPKGSPPDYPVIDKGVSSEWVHYFGMMAKLGYPSNAPLEPYAMVGVIGALTTINDEARVGFGPRFGAGLDYAVSNQVSLYFEVDAIIVTPGDSVDLVDVGGSIDTFTNLGLGFRYSLAR